MKIEIHTSAMTPLEARALATMLQMLAGEAPVEAPAAVEVEAPQPAPVEVEMPQPTPPAPVEVEMPQPAAVEVDAAGTPYDARIHSGAKTVTQAGIWSRRRNVPDEEFARVMREINDTAAEDAPVAVSVPVPAVPVIPAIPAPAAPAVPVPAAPPADSAAQAFGSTPAAGAEPLDFMAVMRRITAAQMGGLTNPDKLAAGCAAAGIAALPGLAAASPEALAAFVAVAGV